MRGVRRSLQLLERDEPELASYVMEVGAELYGRLDRACERHGAVRSLHRRWMTLVLVSLEATRRSR
jgi:hypothetical protein